VDIREESEFGFMAFTPEVKICEARANFLLQDGFKYIQIK